MKRREFLEKSLVGAAATGTAALTGCLSHSGETSAEGSAAVITGERVRWRLASSFPRSLDTIYGGAEVLAERISAMTDGRFQIRLHSAGEIVPGLQVLDAVQQGTVQVGHTASYYYLGKSPVLAFDATVPFGLTARQQNAWLHQLGGAELMDEAFAEFGIRRFTAGNTGVQMGGWFKRPVNSLAELKGLRMRIPGLGGSVMAALGVSVQVLAGGEIFPALERGAIDATEWVGPYDDEKLGFHTIAKHYYYPGWWEPGPSLSYLVGRKAWDELPVVYREVFRAAAAESANAMQERYDAKNPPAFRRLLAAGVDMRPFSDDIMSAAAEASEQVLADASARDSFHAKVWESWKTARSDSHDWFAAAELAYGRFAFPR